MEVRGVRQSLQSVVGSEKASLESQRGEAVAMRGMREGIRGEGGIGEALEDAFR